MFVSEAGTMIGSAGCPVATPVVLGASGAALALGLLVALAAWALLAVALGAGRMAAR